LLEHPCRRSAAAPARPSALIAGATLSSKHGRAPTKADNFDCCVRPKTGCRGRIFAPEIRGGARAASRAVDRSGQIGIRLFALLKKLMTKEGEAILAESSWKRGKWPLSRGMEVLSVFGLSLWIGTLLGLF
jgi:hypothetical protein